MNPNISCDDIDDDKNDDDDDDVDSDEENDNVASLKIKGEMIFKALHKNKIARSNFMVIMLIRLQRIYNFWLFHAIIYSVLDV